jgi:hypothetical protein
MIIKYELKVEVMNPTGELPAGISIAEKLINIIPSNRGSITTRLISLTEKISGGVTNRFEFTSMTGTLVKVEEKKVEEKENLELPEVEEVPKPEKEYPEVSAPFYLSPELQEKLESEKAEKNQDPK